MSCVRRKTSWFLIGLGVGSLVSLLIAPAAGEDLREQLASAARDGAKKAKRRSREAVETFSDFADRGREQINEVVDKGQDIAENGHSQWKDYVERGRDVVNEQVDKL
jgi:gas vesicle protein